MVLLNIEIGRLKIPLYDIATLASGFYIGYNNGKGANVSISIDYLAKYGPTVFTVLATPLMIGAVGSIRKKLSDTAIKRLNDGSLEVTLENGIKKRYRDLSYEEKERVTTSIIEQMEKLKSLPLKYLKLTVISASKTALETLVGYFAGRLCSQFT